jgi:hypothetical protein
LRLPSSMAATSTHTGVGWHNNAWSFAPTWCGRWATWRGTSSDTVKSRSAAVESSSRDVEQQPPVELHLIKIQHLRIEARYCRIQLQLWRIEVLCVESWR